MKLKNKKLKLTVGNTKKSTTLGTTLNIGKIAQAQEI